MSEWKSYKDQSRNINWGTDSESLTLDQINTGSLLRIADSMELLSKKYSDMEKENFYLKKQIEYLKAERRKLSKQASGLRGVITRNKNKSKGKK